MYSFKFLSMVETQRGEKGGNIGQVVQGHFTGVKLGPWLPFTQESFFTSKSPWLGSCGSTARTCAVRCGRPRDPLCAC